VSGKTDTESAGSPPGGPDRRKAPGTRPRCEGSRGSEAPQQTPRAHPPGGSRGRPRKQPTRPPEDPRWYLW